MKGRLRRDETGLVIVEAAFIYPVVFAILIFLLFLSDMFYQRAWIEAAVQTEAIRGSQALSDSQVANIGESPDGGYSLAVGEISNDPYRFLFGTDNSSKAGDRKDALEEKISGGASSILGLAPDITAISASSQSHFLYADYTVTVKYDFTLGIARFVDPQGSYDISLGATSIAPILSTGETIRNADLVDDYYRKLGVGEAVATVTELTDAVQNFETTLCEAIPCE